MATQSQMKHSFLEAGVLHKLRHYLPSQAPLKDFIHHNTLHAFQHLSFHTALHRASEIFGYKTYLSLEEYRTRYNNGEIREDILDHVISRAKGEIHRAEWKQRLLYSSSDVVSRARIGEVRKHWKAYGINMNKRVHPLLFRILSAYLDQGIAVWQIPRHSKGLLNTLRIMERLSSLSGILSSPRSKRLLQDEHCSLQTLLRIVVGEESLFEHYLFDQQFVHPGWSGMVAFIEEHPHSLLEQRPIALYDLIMLELLLEIDVLDQKFGEIWAPISLKLPPDIEPLFAPSHASEYHNICALWQEAFEWSYYDQALAGIQLGFRAREQKTLIKSDDYSLDTSFDMSFDREGVTTAQYSFQAMFCIDDRECSLRRYIELLDPQSQTFGTPGFFNVEFYFQPEYSTHYTKSCPAPLTPKYLIKECDTSHQRERDAHFTKHSHSLLRGWIISQTLGFWSAIKLLESVFKPLRNPASTDSFRHMDKTATLTIERHDDDITPNDDGLFVGFTIAEMTERIAGLLKSTGLITHFAPLVYLIGHGASSSNNTHYAGYDCGACSGRPGSVNARVAATMANHPHVRELLREQGIDIPEATQFLGALHDTTRDEIEFFDENILSADNSVYHHKHKEVFEKALQDNAKERSRRFALIDTAQTPEIIHEHVKLRSFALFEPRPELNHATNTLCIIGRREMTEHLFLDRRAFMNSYNYALDPDGKYLLQILSAATPVCGGINLEYYFSRVDNYRLGAGSKLPHNVIGLLGVANGIDGDLRPGLPSQMIEVHDPTRLMMIVEHFPDVVLRVIQQSLTLYEWFANEWIHLTAIHPETGAILRFCNNDFSCYTPLQQTFHVSDNVHNIVETTQENVPVILLQNKLPHFIAPEV